MNSFLGADTDALRAHAERVSQQARALRELRDSLDPLVMNEAIWQGTDAERFRESWSGGTSTLFRLHTDQLDTQAADLRQHAEEQDTVSEVGGGDGTGIEGVISSPLDVLKDILGGISKLQTLYKGGKSLVDFLRRIPSASGEYGALLRNGLESLWKQSYLDELFKGGKGWQAGAEKLLGKLGLPSSIGNWEPLKFLNKLDDVAPWLKTAGRGLGKVLPFVDLGFGIKKIAESDNWYDRASGIFQTAGGALLIAAPFTGPFAPLVGAIGAGAGIISAGMDLGKLVYENWDGITSAVGGALTNAGNFVADTYSNVSDAVGAVGETVSKGFDTVASTVSDGIGWVGDAFGF